MSRCRYGRSPCGLPFLTCRALTGIVPRSFPKRKTWRSIKETQLDKTEDRTMIIGHSRGHPARREQMRVALVNTNRITPPVAPIGLDYVAETLRASGHRPELLDLCWEEQWEPAIGRFMANGELGLVGGTVRHTDDCSFATRESFLPEAAAMTRCLRAHPAAPIVLGGVGFSVLPEAGLAPCGADAGIRGEGEFALAELAGRLERKLPWDDIPGLVARHGRTWRGDPRPPR